MDISQESIKLIIQLLNTGTSLDSRFPIPFLAFDFILSINCNFRNEFDENSSVSSVNLPLRKFASQCFATFATNLLKFTYGLSIGFTTILIGELSKKDAEIIFTLDELSWFGSGCFMAPVGALLMGIVAQNLGPRRCLLLCSVILFISKIVFYFAKTSGMLLFAQAVTSLIGIVTYGPGATYVIEITEPHLRSGLMATIGFSVIVGAFVNVLLSNWLDWRTIILTNLIPPLLGFVAICAIPESPHWLATKGRLKDAESALAWVRGWTTPEDISSEFNSYKKIYETPAQESQNNPINLYKSGLQHYFQRSFYLPLATVCCMFFLHSWTGLFTIAIYCMVIFKAINAPIDSHIATSLFDCMRIIAAMVCILYVNRTGKRKLMFISLTGAALSYFITASILILQEHSSYISSVYTFNCIATIAILFSTFSTSAGIDKIVFMFNAEIFSAKFRNVGAGIGVFFFAVFGSIVSKSYLYLEKSIGLSGCFLLHWISCIVCCITFYFILPETEGSSLQEIEKRYQKKTTIGKQSHLGDSAEEIRIE